MDYFKHYANASSGKTVNQLEEEFGLSGYAWWFKLVELCAEHWDGKSEPSFRFHHRIFRQKLRISPTNVRVFLDKCSTFTNLSHTFDEKFININIPKLLEVKTSRNVIKSNKKQLTVYKNRIEENRIDYDIATNVTKEASSVKQAGACDYIGIIDYLNEKAGKKFRPETGATKSLIKARFKDGFTVEDFKRVVDHQSEEWKHDAKYSKYLRPETLFGNKFESYLNNCGPAPVVMESIEPIDTTTKLYKLAMEAEAAANAIH